MHSSRWNVVRGTHRTACKGWLKNLCKVRTEWVRMMVDSCGLRSASEKCTKIKNTAYWTNTRFEQARWDAIPGSASCRFRRHSPLPCDYECEMTIRLFRHTLISRPHASFLTVHWQRAEKVYFFFGAEISLSLPDVICAQLDMFLVLLPSPDLQRPNQSHSVTDWAGANISPYTFIFIIFFVCT